MSMQHYAVYDYGLYLDFETLKHMACKACKDCTPEAFSDDEWYYLNKMYEQGYIEYMSEFTGESICIGDNGETLWGLTHAVYSYDSCYYVPAWKHSRMFGSSYENMDELIAEFRDRLGEYLPDDFDYRKNLCLVCGTYFG